MRAPLLALAIATVASLPLVGAQEGMGAQLRLDAHDDFFVIADGGADGEQNPRLGAAAGSTVTVHLANLGEHEHNFVIRGAGDPSIPCCVPPGESRNVTWTVPDDAGAGTEPDARREYTYACAIHEALGMKGVFSVHTPIADDTNATPPTPSDANEATGNDTPWPALVLVLAAVAVVARLRRR